VLKFISWANFPQPISRTECSLNLTLSFAFLFTLKPSFLFMVSLVLFIVVSCLWYLICLNIFYS